MSNTIFPILWDYRDEFPTDQMNKALSSYKHPKVFDVESGGDCNLIVVAEAELSQEQVQELFDQIS